MACDLFRITGTAKVLLIATAASLLSISAASAATVGTPLPTGLPNNLITTPIGTQNTALQTRLDPSSVAKGASLEFPGNGWVTAFRVEMTQINTTGLFKFKILRPAAASQYTVAAESQAYTLEAGIKEYGGYCIPVQQGDHLGLSYGSDINAEAPYMSTGEDQNSSSQTTGDVGVGGTVTVSPSGAAVLMPINAEFRSEAEGCGPVEPPAVDATSPTISDLKRSQKCITYKKSRSKKAGTAKKSRKKRKCAKQSKITYNLSEDATVKTTTSVRRYGLKRKKKGATCKQASNKRRTQVRRSRGLKKKYRACRLFKELGNVESQGKTGANEYTFTGKLNGKTLKPGIYKIGLVATDTAGNVSTDVSTLVRVK